MKAFIPKYAPYIALAACIIFTLAAECRPDISGPSPVLEAAALHTQEKHFTGEALLLRPFLPDEATWNDTLGLWQAHAGLDIACEGDFYAPAEGTIIEVRTDPLWGTCIKIDTDGDMLVLRSLSSVCMQEGEKIHTGDIIGTAGNAPCEADLGRHVHIEYLRGGVLTDPVMFYRENRPL